MQALLLILSFIIVIMAPHQNALSDTRTTQPAQTEESNALRRYLSLNTGPSSMTLHGSERDGNSTAYRITVRSQTWKGIEWTHDLRLVVPDAIDLPHHLLLQIAGSGGSDGAKAPHLRQLAEATGVATAILMDVPNQPLFGDKTEDELIAYTFDRFAESGDQTWPILFPMVKSVQQTMTQLQEFMKKERSRDIRSFIVTGASKRGWTTYLVGATDTRVVGIAPMVFDMLDMKAQTDWAKKMYGEQSEKLQDYTRLNLISRIDEPRMKELRGWVDPINFLDSLTMPKLVLLGTNDPYWVVDSLRHYYPRFTGPANTYVQPNGTHSAGTSPTSLRSLSTWSRLVVQGKPIPTVQWNSFEKKSDRLEVSIQTSGTPHLVRFYHATSTDRDFRNDEWRQLAPTGDQKTTTLPSPRSGFSAVIAEAIYLIDGREMTLSTPPKVFPES